jgi:hypothetical protein
MGEEKWLQGFGRKKLNERNHSEELGVELRILKWILKKRYVRAWTVSVWLGLGTIAGFFNQGTEPWGFVNCIGFP